MISDVFIKWLKGAPLGSALRGFCTGISHQHRLPCTCLLVFSSTLNRIKSGQSRINCPPLSCTCTLLPLLQCRFLFFSLHFSSLRASNPLTVDVRGCSEQKTFLRFSQRHGKFPDFFSPSFRGVLLRAHHFGEKNLHIQNTFCILRPFLMVPRKTKNEKICWALIGSKVFVFRFSKGPNHALHGNTKTKNENHSGMCA